MRSAKPKTELQKLKTDFLEYLEVEKNRSQLTISNYDRYLSKFISFAGKSGSRSPQHINLDLVRKYRLWLNRQNLKLITQNYHVIALRSFLKYLAKRDIKTLTAEKIELPKTPSRQVSFLEGRDLERLLAAPEGQEKDDVVRARDVAILELLFSTGLRVGELSRLVRRDVNLDKDEFSVKGKGDRLRIVFISERAREALKRYLNLRTDNSQALFVRHNRALAIDDHKPLTARSIQRLVKKYAITSGINIPVTPHTLRHTMATDLLTSGADLRSVQEILGHSSITTTQIYTHITNKRLREVHKKYHGRFRGD